jgi:hypothetical protein
MGGMRGFALLMVLVVAAAGAALAAGSSGAAKSGREAAVERTVRAAVHAATRYRNYRRACRFATPRGRQRLLEGFNSSSRPDFADCPAIIASQVRDYPATVRLLRRQLVVTTLYVRERRARVRVAEGSGPFAGRGYLTLVRVDGRWRLDDSNLIPYGN